MSVASASPRSAAPITAPSVPRAAIQSLLFSLLLLGSAAPASGQTPGTNKWEFLISSGSVLPTGAQRQSISRGNMSVAQLSYVVRPALAVTASLGWARSRDLASAGEPKLDVYTYDLGGEIRSPEWTNGRRGSVSAFAAAGGGGRSYDLRGINLEPTHNLAGYIGTGGELGYRRVRMRLELRDYLTGYKPLNGSGTSGTRNDLVLMAGLRFVKR